MNAPESPTLTPAAVELKRLPFAAIALSSTEIQAARRERFNAAELAELATSIKAQDVLQPVLVRPLVSVRPEQQYELVAGERRYLAAQQAGLADLPAVIRPMTDDQVLEAQLVENLQRTGLHELEEAEGYAELMRLKQISADAVAELIGKSRSYVFARLKLRSLVPAARIAYQAGRIDASRALIIARIQPEKKQLKALELAEQKDWSGEGFRLSVRSLKDKLASQSMTVSLAGAPFIYEDELLANVELKITAKAMAFPGSCDDCPNRSGNAPDLTDAAEDPNLCSNPTCFQLKTKIHAGIHEAHLRKNGFTIVDGEAAQKILPRKDFVVGHIDLDHACDADRYPEPEPKFDNDFEDMTPEQEAIYQAWERKDEAYQPRTYRTIVGQDLTPSDLVCVKDPRSGLVRELLPIKRAKALLKRHDLDVADRDNHSKPHADEVRLSPADYKKQAEEHQREQQARQERHEKEKKARFAVARAVWDKLKGPLTRDDLVDVADLLTQNWTIRSTLKELFGNKLPAPGGMKEADLVRLLILVPNVEIIQRTDSKPTALYDLAKRFKVNVDTVRQAALDPEQKPAGPAANAKTTKAKPAKSKPTVKPKSKSKEKK